MVKDIAMETKRFVTKYLILLLTHIILFQIIRTYGLNLLLSIVYDPEVDYNFSEKFQYIITGINIVFNLLFVVFIIIDVKAKKAADWLIITITLFSAQTGLLLLICWKLYNDYVENTRPNTM